MRRLDRYPRRNRVDAVSVQRDVLDTGGQPERECPGRLLFELVGLEHDQDSACRTRGAESGAGRTHTECGHGEPVQGGGAELDGSEVDRRRCPGGNE